MALVRQSVSQPFQRLPTLTAVFLAEASCALTQPGCLLFPAINRHLVRRPALDLEVKSPFPTQASKHAVGPATFGQLKHLFCFVALQLSWPAIPRNQLSPPA